MAIYNITAEGEDGLEEHEVIEALMVLGLHDIAMTEDEEDDIEPHKGGGLKPTRAPGLSMTSPSEGPDF